jgi:hypothetical protein
MRCRHVLLATIFALATNGPVLADGLLDALQIVGSPVTSPLQKFVPAPVVVSTSPNPVPQGPLTPAYDPNYDPFRPTIASAPSSPPPVIYQGPPKSPPPGYTQGTVCQQNGICQLMPIPISPTSTPKASASATPLYPPGYSGSTFALPQTASAQTKQPNGVSLDVSPTAQGKDMSSTRAEVLRVLPK